jgi:hypothetical protein
MMDFQDVEIATLVKFISEITGRNFLIDETIKGKVSVISPSKITVDEAYRVFQSVLQVKGFTLVDTGPVVKILPTKDVKGTGLPRQVGTETPSTLSSPASFLGPPRGGHGGLAAAAAHVEGGIDQRLHPDELDHRRRLGVEHRPARRSHRRSRRPGPGAHRRGTAAPTPSPRIWRSSCRTPSTPDRPAARVDDHARAPATTTGIRARRSRRPPPALPSGEPRAS